MVSGEKPSGTQKEPKGTYGHKSLSKSKITQKNSEAIGNPKGTQWFLGKNPREPKRNLKEPMVKITIQVKNLHQRTQKPSGTQKEPNGFWAKTLGNPEGT